MLTPRYTTEFLEVSLPMADYLRDYRDAPRVQGYCAQCPSYGLRWGCPPFSCDIEAELAGYEQATLVLMKVAFTGTPMPLSEAYSLLRPERLHLEKMVRDREQGGGRAFGLAGMCPYCAEDGCSRREGLPCRRPELVRASLEAYGFDIGLTSERLFGVPLLWSTDGLAPAYMTFVVGYFQ